MMDAYWLFLTAWVLAAAAPGADTALLVSSTLASGWKSAIPASLGITVAKILMLLIAFFGLDAVLTNAPATFVVLKAFGVLFLAWKAVKLWTAQNPFGSGQIKLGRQNFLLAFTTAISNPQAMLFYVAIVPQVTAATNPIILSLIIALGFPLISSVYIWLATPIRTWALKSSNQKTLNRGLAIAFVLIAGVVAIR